MEIQVTSLINPKPFSLQAKLHREQMLKVFFDIEGTVEKAKVLEAISRSKIKQGVLHPLLSSTPPNNPARHDKKGTV